MEDFLDSFHRILAWKVTSTVLVSLVATILWKQVTAPATKPSLPGPPAIPFYGILLYVLRHFETWPTESERLSRLYNYVTWGGPAAMYGMIFYISDPDIVKYVLKDNFDNYEKGDQLRDFFRELLGNGIFAADGDTWYAHRKIASRLFSRRLLKYAASVVNDKCQVVCGQLDTRLKESTDGCCTMDLQDLMLRLTMETTALTTFGVNLDCLGSSGQPHVVASAFEEMQLLCLNRMLDPVFKAKRLFFWFSKRERRIRELKKLLDDFCHELIRSKRNNTASTGDDLLSLFLSHRTAEDQEAVKEELRDVIMNFMVAGRDTMAVALSWTLYELSRHPDVVDKIVAEVNSVCGTGEDADVSFDTVAKLEYTHAVLTEAMRLHPPVPYITKFAAEKDVLPDGNAIPRGSLMVLLSSTMGRSEKIWGPKALEFHPERHLGSGNTDPSSFKYLTFNTGPRTCLGKPLSFMMMKLVLAHLLPKYAFVDKLGHSGEYKIYLVQKMKGGFPVEVSKRQDIK